MYFPPLIFLSLFLVCPDLTVSESSIDLTVLLLTSCLPLILAAVSDVNHYPFSASITSHPRASCFAVNVPRMVKDDTSILGSLAVSGT